MSEQALPDPASVHAYVGMICFKTGPPHRVGAELEWILAPIRHPHRPLARGVLDDLIRRGTSPGRSRITLEPGGQLELSSPVAPDLSRCWRGLERDQTRIDGLLAEHDLAASRVALDPLRSPQRVLRTPRYDAMQEYFDRIGSAGALMMTSTAAVQINLDAGADSHDVAQRWALLHAVGPAMVAAFANSPVHLGRITGWKSTRQRVVRAIDPARTSAPAAPDPVTAWADYALDAPVMMCRRPGRWLAAPGFTFREWVSGVAGVPPPTEDDLAYHLTTLFPPVRPRGWLEIRYVDAQPRSWWGVPLAVLTALLDDPAASDTVREAVAARPLDGEREGWDRAARRGMADPELRHMADSCFEAALSALPRLHADPELTRLVAAYHERFVARGRCPADDFLDELALPEPPDPEPPDHDYHRRTLTAAGPSTTERP